MAKKRKYEPTTAELEDMWLAWGGSFHGPDETGTIPRANLMKLLRVIMKREPPRPDDAIHVQ